MDNLTKDARSIMDVQRGYSVNISRALLEELCDRVDGIIKQQEHEVAVVKSELAASRNDHPASVLSTNQLMQLMQQKNDFAVLATGDDLYRVADESIAPFRQWVKGELFSLIRGFVQYVHDGKSKHLRLNVEVDIEKIRQNPYYPERAVSVLVGVKEAKVVSFVESSDAMSNQSYFIKLTLPEGTDATLYVYTFPKGR